MFTTSCASCKKAHQLDETRVPPSGIVMKCTACGSQMIVMPPSGGGEIGGPPAVRGKRISTTQPPPVVEPAPPAPPAEIVDLPAPKRPTQQLTDLRPVDILDLPTPVGPVPTRGIVDLPTPVGPVPTKGIVDLPTPVGPVPTKGVTDLLTPVGPVPTKGVADLLTPVGPVPTRGIDLPTPVGPTATRGIDLPTPVGPVPTRGIDLPAPVGPVQTKGIDLPAPVGPSPTRGVDLPAPKGFFDDAPPPASGNRPKPRELSLDDLDVVPAGAPQTHDTIEFPPAATDAGFSMDSLTLESPTDIPPEQPSYGNVELPASPSEDMPSVISFGKPSAAASDSLDLAEPARRKKPGTVVDSAEKPARAPRVARPGRTLLFSALAVAIVGGGAFYVYQNVELEVAGFRTAPAQERQDKIAAGLSAARRLLLADDWRQAATAAERAAPADEEGTDLLGLAAQGYLAAAIDLGTSEKADRAKGDGLLQTAQGRGELGTEAKKAQGLRMILDGKAAEAGKLFGGLPNDPNTSLYRGWAALEARDFKAAQAAFSAALQTTPGRVPALYGLGRAHLGAGEIDKAREAFHQLVDKKQHYGAWLALTEIDRPPGSPERERELGVLCERAPERERAHPRDLSRAWTLYAAEAIAVGRWEQAAERYRKAREIWERNFEAAVGGALVDLELRASGASIDLAQARTVLARAAELDPKDITALIGLARVALLDSKLEEAKKAIDAAVAADEKNPRAHYWKGRILEQLEEVEGAEGAYQKAIDLGPKDFTAHVALSRLLASEASAAARGGKQDKAKALNDRAVAVLAPVSEAAKNDAPLAITLGTAYLNAANPTSAEGWFRRAVAVDGQNVDGHYNLARALEAQGKIADAVVEYDRARVLAPRRDDIALGLAGALQKQKSWATADALYAKLLSTDGGNTPSARVRAAAARYYARTERMDEALKQGPLIASTDPANPTVAFLHGVELNKEGKRDDAVKALKDAIAGAPEPEFWDALGRVLEQKVSLQEAQAAYTEANRLDPTYPSPLIGLGHIHLVRREFGGALRDLKAAAALAPERADVWAMIGDAHYGLSANNLAIGAYAESLRLKDDPEIHWKLGRAYGNSDDPRGAVEHLKRATAAAPPDAEWLPEALRTLGFRYQADNKRTEMCAAFARYLEVAKPNELLHSEVKRHAAGCP